ncbi:MAG: hypothetical protein IJ928_07775 [Prevotella sp.]|nr:hypothetical protein [Prevotella sp.]
MIDSWTYRKCKACGHDNHYTNKVCEKCGGELQEYREWFARRPKYEDFYMSQYVCQDCGNVMTAKEPCNVCNSTRVERTDVCRSCMKTSVCIRCGYLTHRRTHDKNVRCPKCGEGMLQGICNLYEDNQGLPIPTVEECTPRMEGREQETAEKDRHISAVDSLMFLRWRKGIDYIEKEIGLDYIRKTWGWCMDEYDIWPVDESPEDRRERKRNRLKKEIMKRLLWWRK